MSDYLNGKLTHGDEIETAEYDFCFKYDCSLEWIVSLWYDCCPFTNRFSTILDEEQAEKLRDYLREIVGAKNDNNS